MVPYLQKLIDKYKVSISFDEYMSGPQQNREKELDEVRICRMVPEKTIGRKMMSNRVRIYKYPKWLGKCLHTFKK